MENNSQNTAVLAGLVVGHLNQSMVAADLRRQQQEARQEDEELEDEEDENEFNEELGEAVEDFVHGEKTSLVKHALKIGLILRQQASDLRFDGLAFWFILLISGIKDFIDVITFSGSGWLTTWFITPILMIFFFFRKSFFKRFFIKRYLGKFIIAVILDFFPGTSMFPTYVLSTLLLKRRIDKEIKKLHEEAKEKDKEAGEISRARI